MESVKTVRSPRKNGRRAVALVDVAIHRHGALDGLVFLQAANADGKIVEHAEALAVVRVGVVKSSAHVDRCSLLERQSPRQN